MIFGLSVEGVLLTHGRHYTISWLKWDYIQDGEGLWWGSDPILELSHLRAVLIAAQECLPTRHIWIILVGPNPHFGVLVVGGLLTPGCRGLGRDLAADFPHAASWQDLGLSQTCHGVVGRSPHVGSLMNAFSYKAGVL